MAQHELRAQIIVSGKEDGSLSQLGDKLLGMGQQIQQISQAALDFEKESVETYRNYEDGILETRSVLQSTYDSAAKLDRDMESLEKHAQEWAETTIFGTDDVANAMANASHAGWDYEKIIQGIPAAMLAAQAGGLELADGVDYLTKMMAATGTGFDQATNYVNEWAKASDLAATNIEDMGEAFLKLGTASRLADSNEELFTFMSILANSGTTGSSAGTALRNVMARIAAPTSKAEEAMEALGLSEEEAEEALSGLDESSAEAYQRLEEMGFSAYDAQGNLRPFMDILSDMNIMLGDMDEKSKNDFLKTLFGTKSFQYAMALLDAANSGEMMSIYEAILGVKDTDYAQEKIDTLMSGLSGSIDLMEAKWQEFQRKIGETLSTPIEGGIGVIDSIIDGLNGLDPIALDALTTAITTIALAAPALTIAGTAAKIIGTLGIGSGFAWMALAAGVLAASDALYEFKQQEFEDQFGEMDLDTDPLNKYLEGVTTTFTNLNAQASIYNAAIGTALTNYTEASVSLSSDLLSKVITGTTLTEDDIANITNLGAAMHDALVDGIENGTAESMSWFEALFSYGGNDAYNDENFLDIIFALDTANSEALSRAEQLGNKLGKAISDAVKDGIVSGDEYAAIKDLMDQYNDAMEQYAHAERAGQNAQALHAAQTVSWDSYSEWAQQQYQTYQENLASNDSEYWYNYGKMKDLYAQYIANGTINQTTGVAYTQQDWIEAAAAMRKQYTLAKEDYNSGYEQAIMTATQQVLKGSGMWDAFEYLMAHPGEGNTDEFAQALADNPNLQQSMVAMAESAGYMGSTLKPWLSAFGIDYDQIVADAQTLNEVLRLDELEQMHETNQQLYQEAFDREQAEVEEKLAGDNDYQTWQDITSYLLKPAELFWNLISGEYETQKGAYDDLQEYTSQPKNEFWDERDTEFETQRSAFFDLLGYIFGGSARAEDDVEHGPTVAEVEARNASEESNVAVTYDDNGSGEALKSEEETLFGSTIEQYVSVSDGGSAASLRASIESTFSSTITQHVSVVSSGAVKSKFAEGGRATEASIFGEAGAEWAIPEQHTQRTADLLSKAAEASGFTWAELLTRNGGLNSGSGSGATTFVYSPTINAGATDGIEKALSDDKERLEKWWREKTQREAAASYA